MANEKRLIDADLADSRLADDNSCGEKFPVSWFRSWLALQETVDAVEVVRCEDCKYRVLDTVNGEDWCNHTLGLCGEVYATDFCCNGERKDND